MMLMSGKVFCGASHITEVMISINKTRLQQNFTSPIGATFDAIGVAIKVAPPVAKRKKKHES